MPATSPRPRPDAAATPGGCARDAEGVIVTGRSLRYDLVHLREDLRALFD